MLKDREVIVDIESNRSEFPEDPRHEQATGGKRVKNMLNSLGLTTSFKKLDDGENNSEINRNHDIESLVNGKVEGKKRENMPNTKEKQKVKNSKRAAKPPRPRKGPSLSASDLRLVKEISELVMKKRARIERLKSLKKARSARLLSAPPPPSSALSYTSLFAMIITVLFLIVIMFH